MASTRDDRRPLGKAKGQAAGAATDLEHTVTGIDAGEIEETAAQVCGSSAP